MNKDNLEHLRKKQLKIFYGVLIIVLIIAGISFMIIDNKRKQRIKESGIPTQKIDNLTKALKKSGCIITSTSPQGAGMHTTEKVFYSTNPPTSGEHHPEWTEDGVYSTPPQLEKTVHALEHGRVNIQYRNLSNHQIKQLEALREEFGGGYHQLLFPNQTSMPYKLALTTWGESLTCTKWSKDIFDAARLFRDKYIDDAPEVVP